MKKSTLVIEWPKSFFSVNDIKNKHPNEKEITLRFRINKAIEENKIAYIGKNQTKVGRPTIVFAPCPLEDSVLQDAVNNGVILDESLQDKVVAVAKSDTSNDPEPTYSEEEVVNKTDSVSKV